MITGFFTDLLYILIVTLTTPFWIMRFRSPSFRKIVRARLNPSFEKREGRKSVWLHAVSVGEVKSLTSFIKEFASHSEYQVLLSVTTVSGYEFAKENLPDITIIPSPLDFSWTIRKFFRAIEPDIIVLNELEIWPNWLLTAKLRGVPVILMNGRISTPAFKKYMKLKFLMSPVFNRISTFFLQADIYAERFKAIGIPSEKLQVLGNIKADEAIAASESLHEEKDILKHLKTEPGTAASPSVFASTHPEDINLIIPALKETGHIPSVIVPRHPSSAEKIAEKINNIGLKAAIWSKSSSVNLNTEILIYDSIGYLFNILKIAGKVYMGGTCSKETGGHNLYEPAVLNKPLVGGPHCDNFPVIFKLLKENSLYRTTSTPAELSEVLKPESSLHSKTSSREIVVSLSGTNRKIMEKLVCLLK